MIKLYSASVGLDTAHDPKNIGYDPAVGVTGLQSAVNVKVDSDGKLSRCNGYSELVTGSYHSGWGDGELAYCGKGTAIYRMNADGTFTGVRSGLTGGRVAFARRGGRVYYSNGVHTGYITEATSTAWSMQTYVGPTTMKAWSAAPKARCLAFFNGRAYLSDYAEPNVLYWSESGQPGLFNKVNHRKFESAILMIAPCNSGDAGLFVSTESATYFVTGAPAITLKKVADYPAYEGSVCSKKYACRNMGIDMDGHVVLWRGQTGLCAGLPNGTMLNLTEELVDADMGCGGYGATVLIGDLCIHTVSGRTLITNLAVGEPTKKATTKRTNYQFNSFIELNGTYYGLNSSGVYTLGGDDDDGTAISAYFETPASTLGSDEPLRLQYAYLSGEIESGGSMQLTITPNQDATRAVTKTITPVTDEYHKMAQKLGEGAIAGRWSFKLANVAGCNFYIQDMEVLPVEIRHRFNKY